jgi:hypothetical protein
VLVPRAATHQCMVSGTALLVHLVATRVQLAKHCVETVKQGKKLRDWDRPAALLVPLVRTVLRLRLGTALSVQLVATRDRLAFLSVLPVMLVIYIK